MSNRKNIVLITTWFPPAESVAVNRMVAFAKYLDKTRYNVTVLTEMHKGAVSREYLYDCTVLRFSNRQVLKRAQFKTGESRLWHKMKSGWNILVQKAGGDVYASWRKQVERELLKIHREQKIDAIISSFSPEAAHQAALNFCKSSGSGVKWIADMRDEMSQNPSIDERTRKKYLALEAGINRFASAITAVSAPQVELFRKTTMPGVKHLVEIRNGYDHDLDISKQPFNDVFTIVYCGIFYGEHKPAIFLNALNKLHVSGKLPAEWKLNFVGTHRNFDVPQELLNHVHFIPRVNQLQSLAYMAQADANLLLIPKTNRVGVYTGKLFDYISVYRPVLAIVSKDDVAADLLDSLGMGYIAGNDNSAEIEDQLVKLIEDWRNKKELSTPLNQIHQLHRKIQIQKLNLLLDQLFHES